MAGAVPLSLSDAESVYNAVLKLVLQYPNYPITFKASHDTVKWNSINTEESIGLFPRQGAIYIKQYVSGSYVGRFPFTIVYKSNPTSNPGSINSQLLVDNLAKWLETCGVSFTDAHITLEEIKQTSPVYASGQTITDQEYSVNMQLQYFYKKGW